MMLVDDEWRRARECLSDVAGRVGQFPGKKLDLAEVLLGKNGKSRKLG
jgi:hypothetical protein